jgi:hypothetical protein
MKSIFYIVASLFLMSATVFADYGVENSSAQEEYTLNIPSEYTYVLRDVLGLGTNAFGLIKTTHDLTHIEKETSEIIYYFLIVGGLLDLATHLGNLLGYSVDLMDWVGNKVEHKGLLGTGALLTLNSISLTNHILNIIFIERIGLAKIFSGGDWWEIYVHGQDIWNNL